MKYFGGFVRLWKILKVKLKVKSTDKGVLVRGFMKKYSIKVNLRNMRSVRALLVCKN